METTLPISPRPSPSPSPPAATNLHRTYRLSLRRNVSDEARFSMSLTDLTLRRVTGATSPFQFRFKSSYHSYPLPLPLNSQIITPICPRIMADEPKKTDVQPQHDSAATMLDACESKDGKQKGSEKPTAAPIPPPPEKPLPGDCCGSGCVRCVWDVYYEELEEYNRLYPAN